MHKWGKAHAMINRHLSPLVGTLPLNVSQAHHLIWTWKKADIDVFRQKFSDWAIPFPDYKVSIKWNHGDRNHVAHEQHMPFLCPLDLTSPAKLVETLRESDSPFWPLAVYLLTISSVHISSDLYLFKAIFFQNQNQLWRLRTTVEVQFCGILEHTSEGPTNEKSSPRPTELLPRLYQRCSCYDLLFFNERTPGVGWGLWDHWRKQVSFVAMTRGQLANSKI